MELTAARFDYDDREALVEDYHRRGWTDGLPIVPPDPDTVELFLAAAGLDPAEVLGAVPTREVIVTAEQVAINAVMAGCRPEYMPVVVAAVRAHLSEKGNCHSTTGTLSGAAPGRDRQRANDPEHRQPRYINCVQGASARMAAPTPPSAGPCGW